MNLSFDEESGAPGFNAKICTRTSCINATVYPEDMQQFQDVLNQNGTGMSVALDPKDGSWIVTTAIIIFTMQTGKSEICCH